MAVTDMILSLCPSHGKTCEAVHGGSFERFDLFFAYPSEPPAHVEAVTGAIQRLRDLEPDLMIGDWAEMPIEGTNVFCTICSRIRGARCLVADVTGFNFNVMFELGYAVGVGTPIYPVLDVVPIEVVSR